MMVQAAYIVVRQIHQVIQEPQVFQMYSINSISVMLRTAKGEGHETQGG